MRRRMLGLLEAYVAASYLAMAMIAMAFGSEPSANKVWDPSVGVAGAPWAMPLFLTASVQPEPDFLSTAKKYALIFCLVPFLLIAIARWARWGQKSGKQFYPAGRLANLYKALGDGMWIGAMLIFSVFGAVVVSFIESIQLTPNESWLQAAATLLIPGTPYIVLGWIVFHRITESKKTIEPRVCPTCDYNLTGNVSGVCPECGNAIPRRLLSKGICR